jgi:hypothetical protein
VSPLHLEGEEVESLDTFWQLNRPVKVPTVTDEKVPIQQQEELKITSIACI